MVQGSQHEHAAQRQSVAARVFTTVYLCVSSWTTKQGKGWPPQSATMSYLSARVLHESGELNAARWFLFVGGRHGWTDIQHGRVITASAGTWQRLMYRCRYHGRGRRRHQTGCSVTGQFQLQMQICMTRLHLTNLHISHTHKLETPAIISTCILS